MFGASVVGTSHLSAELPCQDAHAVRLLPGGALLVAVADGAGSAARAEEGARRAVERAMDWLEIAMGEPPTREDGWRAAMLGAFRAASEGLDELAAADDVPLRAFATTLTCVVATADCLVVGQIGDGVAVARNEHGRLFTTIRPRRGEYANEASFLTMPRPLDHVDLVVYPQPVDGLAITTDGLLRLAMELPEHEPHRPFFLPLFAFAAEVEDVARGREHLAAFLASDRVGARTDDDKTLVLAVRVSAPLGPDRL